MSPTPWHPRYARQRGNKVQSLYVCAPRCNAQKWHGECVCYAEEAQVGHYVCIFHARACVAGMRLLCRARYPACENQGKHSWSLFADEHHTCQQTRCNANATCKAATQHALLCLECSKVAQSKEFRFFMAETLFPHQQGMRPAAIGKNLIVKATTAKPE